MQSDAAATGAAYLEDGCTVNAISRFLRIHSPRNGLPGRAAG